MTVPDELIVPEPATKPARRRRAPTTVTDLIPTTGRLTIESSQGAWTAPQLAALATIGLADVPEGDQFAFLHLCQRSGLDPFSREIYLIGRKDSKAPTGTRYTAQTGIDGYRHIAERTGEYAGQLGPFWCGPDGQWTDVWLADEPPVAARTGILRKGHPEPFWGTCLYREYVPMKDEWLNNKRTGREVPSGLWGKMPAAMVAKCSLALAIRAAFPRQVSGIYTTEEMEQADATRDRAALEEANATRDAQRTEYAKRSWSGVPDPASPGETVPKDRIIDADPLPSEPAEPLDRDALWAELTAQAEALGQTVSQMCRRWAAARKKNPEQATDVELRDLVEARRTVAVAQERPADPSDRPVAAEPPNSGERAAEPPNAPQEAAPHLYRAGGDTLGDEPCCEQPIGDPIHLPVPPD